MSGLLGEMGALLEAFFMLAWGDGCLTWGGIGWLNWGYGALLGELACLLVVMGDLLGGTG